MLKLHLRDESGEVYSYKAAPWSPEEAHKIMIQAYHGGMSWERICVVRGLTETEWLKVLKVVRAGGLYALQLLRDLATFPRR